MHSRYFALWIVLTLDWKLADAWYYVTAGSTNTHGNTYRIVQTDSDSYCNDLCVRDGPKCRSWTMSGQILWTPAKCWLKTTDLSGGWDPGAWSGWPICSAPTYGSAECQTYAYNQNPLREGTVATAICNPGYDYPNPAAKSGVCWRGVGFMYFEPPPHCVPTCGRDLMSKHGSISYEKVTGSVTAGSQAFVTCDPVYVPSSASSTAVTCVSMNQWSSNPTDCELYCDVPQDSTATDYTLNGIYLAVDCNEGYFRLDKHAITAICRNDANYQGWQPEPTICVPTCKRNWNIRNGLVTYSGSDDEPLIQGEKATLQCFSPYETEFPITEVMCVGIDTWSATLTNCIIRATLKIFKPSAGDFDYKSSDLQTMNDIQSKESCSLRCFSHQECNEFNYDTGSKSCVLRHDPSQSNGNQFYYRG